MMRSMSSPAASRTPHTALSALGAGGQGARAATDQAGHGAFLVPGHALDRLLPPLPSGQDPPGQIGHRRVAQAGPGRPPRLATGGYGASGRPGPGQGACTTSTRWTLNCHRPCYFPQEEMDAKGKIKKRHRYGDMMTLYEKLRSLPDAAGYLKPGVNFNELVSRLRHRGDNYSVKEDNRHDHTEPAPATVRNCGTVVPLTINFGLWFRSPRSPV